jgi:hypothetical protein
MEEGGGSGRRIGYRQQDDEEGGRTYGGGLFGESGEENGCAKSSSTHLEGIVG